ncbi:hypothetical protein, partial [Helicobacter sp. T3_23-1059]
LLLALFALLLLLCMVRDRNEVGCNTWFLVVESDIFTSLVENNELLLVALSNIVIFDRLYYICIMTIQ